MKRNYLIIGASGGIGNAITAQLLEQGHQVFGTYFKQEPVSNPTGMYFHYLNVLDDTLDLNYLPESIDGVVYCPGSILLRPFDKIKPTDFIRDYQLQVTGAVSVLQTVLPRLKKSPGASVVLFSTVAVQTRLPFHTLVAASKGAVEGLAKSLAAEWAPHIRVNAIAPSLTDTPLAHALLNSEVKREANAQKHPLKKIGTANDIAHMATFLLSEQSSWITGQIFHVDGGLSTLKT